MGKTQTAPVDQHSKTHSGDCLLGHVFLGRGSVVNRARCAGHLRPRQEQPDHDRDNHERQQHQ